MENNKDGVLFIRSIPRALKQDFKAWCDKQGTDMTKAILNYMKEVTHENKSIEKAINP